MQASGIIISIRPEHARNIMAGRKTVELRRRFPASVLHGTTMLIYSSTPERALVGAVRIGRCIE
jgi:predicted transcriptional regulator